MSLNQGFLRFCFLEKRLRRQPEKWKGINGLSGYSRVLIFLLLIPVQTIVLEKVKIAGVKPDIALVFVFVQGWIFGRRQGGLWGAALGGLIDLFSTGILGITLILKGLVGLIAGELGKSFLHLSLQGYVLFFIGISLLHDVAGLVFLHGFDFEELRFVLTGEILMRAVYNTVLAVIAIVIVWEKFNQKGNFEYGGAILSPGRKPGTRK